MPSEAYPSKVGDGSGSGATIDEGRQELPYFLLNPASDDCPGLSADLIAIRLEMDPRRTSHVPTEFANPEGV